MEKWGRKIFTIISGKVLDICSQFMIFAVSSTRNCLSSVKAGFFVSLALLLLLHTLSPHTCTHTCTSHAPHMHTHVHPTYISPNTCIHTHTTHTHAHTLLSHTHTSHTYTHTHTHTHTWMQLLHSKINLYV